tara:strand:+ start:44 stop:502 length:459 start_codon:yes stop_codon:yes gene_type:complete
MGLLNKAKSYTRRNIEGKKEVVEPYAVNVSPNLKPPKSQNFGLGGVGKPRQRMHERDQFRPESGKWAKPENDMSTMGFHEDMKTFRPQSLLEGGLDDAAQYLRDMEFQQKLQEMLEFIYKVPKGLLSMPMIVPRQVLQGEGLLRGSNRENGS